MPSFEFNEQLVPQSLIDVENLGEFAIEASNDDGGFYYLVVRTSLGTVTMASCGPVIPDVEFLPSGYKAELNRTVYKEDKLFKTVNFWLNDKSKKLTDAKIITVEEAIDQFRDLKYYLNNYSEELY